MRCTHTGRSGQPSPDQCLLKYTAEPPCSDTTVQRLQYWQHCSCTAVVHDAAGSCCKITQAVLHPMPFTQPCQNSQVSTHRLSMTLSFTVSLEGKTSCKNNCIQASKGGALCYIHPPCLCAFLEATDEDGSSNSLALESAGPDIAQCNQHPICQLEKEKRAIQRRLGIARKEIGSYFYTSGCLWLAPEKHECPHFSCLREASKRVS